MRVFWASLMSHHPKKKDGPSIRVICLYIYSLLNFLEGARFLWARFFWLKLIICQEKPSRVKFLPFGFSDSVCTCAEVLVPCKVTRIGSVTSVTLKFGWMDTPPAVPTVQKESTVDGRNPANQLIGCLSHYL